MILRTIKCAICGKEQTEQSPNEGWIGWSGMLGIALDGDEQPQFCPHDTAKIADFVDYLKQQENK